MPNHTKSSADSELAVALNRIGAELQLIREVLDEFRTDFQWAVQNGRVVHRDDLTNCECDALVRPTRVGGPLREAASSPMGTIPELPEPGNLF